MNEFYQKNVRQKIKEIPLASFAPWRLVLLLCALAVGSALAVNP
jgi:hypothetical protein